MKNREYGRGPANDVAVERALDVWREHMQAWSHPGRVGFPSRSPVFATGGASESFDHLCEVADRHAGRVMEALIDGLPAIERAALNHRYLGTIWRFQGLDEALLSAKANLRRRMPSRGLPVD